ncbi:Enolase [Fusarium oxysporum f. sp. albedinis]|nr:Enolase [Fusarium oxysporum f. sp. albedinis]
MVPCILRPGLLHFVLPFTGQHKHQTGQGYKKRSDLALPHAGLSSQLFDKLHHITTNMPAQRPSQLPPCPGPPPSRPLPPLPKQG